MVPLNAARTILDLMERLNLPVMVVSRHYLGSINHTLMTLEVLKQRGITVAGILFNGDPHPTTESVIEQMSGVPVIGRIPHLSEVSPTAIEAAADTLRSSLLRAL